MLVTISNSVLVANGFDDVLAMVGQKSKEFFIIENGVNVYLHSFDYEYVRSSLVKILDVNRLASNQKTSSSEYTFDVVMNVESTTDGSAVRIDHRTVDLKHIFYMHKRLSVYDKMVNDIIFSNSSNKNKQHVVPRLNSLITLHSNNSLKSGKEELIISQTDDSSVPAIKAPTRVEIREDDERISMFDDKSKALMILDWVDNFEICNSELTQKVKSSGASQLEIASLVKSSSEIMHKTYLEVKETLNEIFQLERGFFSKMFKPQIQINVDEVGDIIEKLRETTEKSIINVKSLGTKFNQTLDEMQMIDFILDEGIEACSFAIALDDESESFKVQYDLRKNRLLKAKTSNEISRLQFVSFRDSYDANISKMEEIQQVAIPLLITKIIQSSGKVDEETLNLTKNIVNVKINVD